ncbi:hypothetical protein N7495_007602 [Penicillium taxi]|uniref:uncharacterized protein n=1 Tax=Penicillium taxi TaxID=168475 RepID=UPI0025450EE3|nr:uncharacterized protein N7495_007602 [Penicillium taxi]KAJ5887561.1 hypothetical protein N7495_007602 [Penicillium taxi]
MQYSTLNMLRVLLPLFACAVHANVEKTIFLAPEAAIVPSGEPGLDDLGLERLSPENPVIRTRLNTSFPVENLDSDSGTDSWFFLENLTPGQRYEVRVCWPATQPTAFELETYSLARAFENTTLLSALSIFGKTRLASLDANLQTNAIPRRASGRTEDSGPMTDSVLFLRVRAAADYFTTNETLMKTPSPVLVDLILDPFLWNVFPRSLVPTAGWIVVVAVAAVFVARWVAAELGRVIEDARQARKEEEEDKKEQ